MKKEKELEDLLQQYAPPKINDDIRRTQIARLSRDIQDMDYFPPQSFTVQILTQLSFISGWIWFAQAGILFLLFFCVFRAHPFQIDMMLFCLSPGLSLILVYEMTKSFRMNIWEMESACRYNLVQIFFFRLCILFGGDFLVLTGALIAYRMADGLLWRFCLFALLPFFLCSAISLYVLRCIGNRCNVTVTAATPLLTGVFVTRAVIPISEYMDCRNISLTKGIPLITILAFAALLYNALRLCAGAHHLCQNRKEHKAWNYE